MISSGTILKNTVSGTSTDILLMVIRTIKWRKTPISQITYTTFTIDNPLKINIIK
jgi:hypothetical protein